MALSVEFLVIFLFQATGLMFALPGRWTGGKREEEEMRRLVALQRDLHGDTGDTTSQSDWSDEDDLDAGI